MKVKIGNKIYNPSDEPIMIILNELDKQLIGSMGCKAFSYCCFPEQYSQEEMESFMKTNKIISYIEETELDEI